MTEVLEFLMYHLCFNVIFMDINWFYFGFKGKIILASNYILMNLYLYSKIAF